MTDVWIPTMTKSAAVKLKSARDVYDQRCAEMAAELQRRLRDAFYERRSG